MEEKKSKSPAKKTTQKSVSKSEITVPEQGALFLDLNQEITSFEIEPSESEKEADKIKSEVKKEKRVISQSIVTSIPEETNGLSEFSDKFNEQINLSKSIIVIENDIENKNARDIATGLNKIKKEIEERRKKINSPFDKAIKDNNESAKKMTLPIEKEIDRLKLQISSFETQKERKRLEELAKTKKAQEDAQKLEQAEKDRVTRINTSIEKMRIDLSAKIESVTTSEKLDTISKQLEEWVPKKDYYQEFMPKVEELVDSLKTKIKLRYNVVKELEKASAKGDEKKITIAVQKLEEIKQKEEVVAEEKKEGDELSDFQATQQLISLFSSIGVEDVASSVERVIGIYGSAKIALTKKEELIASFQQLSLSKEKEAELKAEEMKNQRVDFTFEIIDKSKIPMEFLKVDEVALRAAIKEKRSILVKDINGYVISGVEIKKKITTVLR